MGAGRFVALREPFANNCEPFANPVSLFGKAVPRGPAFARSDHPPAPDQVGEESLHHPGAGRVLEPLADIFDAGFAERGHRVEHLPLPGGELLLSGLGPDGSPQAHTDLASALQELRLAQPRLAAELEDLLRPPAPLLDVAAAVEDVGDQVVPADRRVVDPQLLGSESPGSRPQLQTSSRSS